MITLLIAIALLQAGVEPAAPGGDDGGDAMLLESVQNIARDIEELRGQAFVRPPQSVRAPDGMLDVAAKIRAYNVLSRDRLEARGRAWSDLGLGGLDSPRRLLLTLAADLAGVGFDPEGNRLLVSPDRLPDEDFEPSEDLDDSATILLLTGVRPDEPLVSHLLMHVRQRERAGRDPMLETTDGLLADMAWAEGEANLVALRYLFDGMGLADDVVGTTLNPGEVLDGILLPSRMEELTGVERGFVEFVYRDGFVRAVEVHRTGGWEALDRAMARQRTTRDLLHPQQALWALPEFPEPVAPAEGWTLADQDSLGEQAIVVLVSLLTGSDSLGLVAGEGWSGDRLYRWEDDGGAGITDWQTRWRSDQAATDFDYALGRALAARFPDAPFVSPQEGGRVLVTGDRIYRLERGGLAVRVRVTPAGQTVPGG